MRPLKLPSARAAAAAPRVAPAPRAAAPASVFETRAQSLRHTDGSGADALWDGEPAAATPKPVAAAAAAAAAAAHRRRVETQTPGKGPPPADSGARDAPAETPALKSSEAGAREPPAQPRPRGGARRRDPKGAARNRSGRLIMDVHEWLYLADDAISRPDDPRAAIAAMGWLQAANAAQVTEAAAADVQMAVARLLDVLRTGHDVLSALEKLAEALKPHRSMHGAWAPAMEAAVTAALERAARDEDVFKAWREGGCVSWARLATVQGVLRRPSVAFWRRVEASTRRAPALRSAEEVAAATTTAGRLHRFGAYTAPPRAVQTLLAATRANQRRLPLRTEVSALRWLAELVTEPQDRAELGAWMDAAVRRGVPHAGSHEVCATLRAYSHAQLPLQGAARSAVLAALVRHLPGVTQSNLADTVEALAALRVDVGEDRELRLALLRVVSDRAGHMTARNAGVTVTALEALRLAPPPLLLRALRRDAARHADADAAPAAAELAELCARLGDRHALPLTVQLSLRAAAAAMPARELHATLAVLRGAPNAVPDQLLQANLEAGFAAHARELSVAQLADGLHALAQFEKRASDATRAAAAAALVEQLPKLDEQSAATLDDLLAALVALEWTGDALDAEVQTAVGTAAATVLPAAAPDAVARTVASAAAVCGGEVPGAVVNAARAGLVRALEECDAAGVAGVAQAAAALGVTGDAAVGMFLSAALVRTLPAADLAGLCTVLIGIAQTEMQVPAAGREAAAARLEAIVGDAAQREAAGAVLLCDGLWAFAALGAPCGAALAQKVLSALGAVGQVDADCLARLQWALRELGVLELALQGEVVAAGREGEAAA